MKKIIFVIMICLLFAFVGCASNEAPNNNQVPAIQENPQEPENEEEPLQERPTSVGTTEAILLDNLPSNIDAYKYSERGITATYNDISEDLNIEQAGVYEFTGVNTGAIIVAQGIEVSIILNNAEFSIDDKNVVSAGKSSTIFITSLYGTQNSIRNCNNSSQKEFDAINTKGSIIINGQGKLNVISESKSAIKASEGAVIVETDLTISAKNHGISANGVIAKDCRIKINAAGKDGINSEATNKTFAYTQGFVYINNVNYICNVDGDGIQADTYSYAKTCEIEIKTNGEFVEKTAENIAAYKLEESDFAFSFKDEKYYKVPKDFRTEEKTYYALKQSCKGIKVSGKFEKESGEKENNNFIYIDDSNISIDTLDDSIKCKLGSVAVKGNEIDIKTIDHAIEGELNTTIYRGTFNIDAYEGICGTYIEIAGGEFNIRTSDDGINASSEEDGITPYIIISGGKILLDIYDSKGDAIDANGKILIKGGEIVAHTTGQEALDSDYGTWIDAGSLIGVLGGAIPERMYYKTQLLNSFFIRTNICAVDQIKIQNGDELLFDITAMYNASILVFANENIINGDIIKVYLNDELLKEIEVDNTFMHFE